MEQIGIRCTFMRGGTSKGMFFRWEDLPEDDGDRDHFLCAAIGSPDPYGRQLDGMGGGISSLSKAMFVRRSCRENVDIDYLFAQIVVDKPEVDYASNCGNLSAAVGAFAVDQGLVQFPDGPAKVRMFNENTAKRIDCNLTLRDGRAAIIGDQDIAGVTGTGAPIRLDFHEPGGARTGSLLPVEVNGIRSARASTDVIGSMPIEFSFVDAANPCVFVAASDLGLTGTEMPAEIAANAEVMSRLEEIRQFAGRYMPGVQDEETGQFSIPESAPKIAIVGPPASSRTLSGETQNAEECDVQVRMISMGKPHLAIPLTGAMCTAVAARIPGTTVADAARAVGDSQPLRIGTPSGVVPAMSEVTPEPRAISASVYRTARTLMEGTVYAAI
ncbi:MAG: PrpF domain-containing protein [Pseudomonadota bacterium]